MFNNIKLSTFLAFRSMRKGNKSTMLLIIFIMSMVFVNLVFINSIFLGVTEATNNKVINSLYSNVVIEPKKDEKYISDVYSLEQKIKNIPGVMGISAQYVTGATLSFEDKYGTWTVRSINPDDEMKVTTNHNFLIAGKYLSKLDRNEILISIVIPRSSAAAGTRHSNCNLIRARSHEMPRSSAAVGSFTGKEIAGGYGGI